MAADSELNPAGRVSDVISVSQFPATVAAKNPGSIARAGEYTLLSSTVTGAAELFLNRELSQLAFNRRVLTQAENPDVPLLERLRWSPPSCFRTAILSRSFRSA